MLRYRLTANQTESSAPGPTYPHPSGSAHLLTALLSPTVKADQSLHTYLPHLQPPRLGNGAGFVSVSRPPTRVSLATYRESLAILNGYVFCKCVSQRPRIHTYRERHHTHHTRDITHSPIRIKYTLLLLT